MKRHRNHSFWSLSSELRLECFAIVAKLTFDQKKFAKCLQKLPKMISLEKLKILAPTQKLPKTERCGQN